MGVLLQTLETFDVQRIDTALIDALSLSMQTSSARRLASATHLGEQKRLATALVAKQFDAVYSSLYRKVSALGLDAFRLLSMSLTRSGVGGISGGRLRSSRRSQLG
eukprot:scaffold1666_cov424-Prasinococcus_capsulatus_cf.AAC.11